MNSFQKLWFGKTSAEHSAATTETTSTVSSKNSASLLEKDFLRLDLRSGQNAVKFWATPSQSLGDYLMLNFGESPSEDVESTLSWILEDNVQEKYYLSPRACVGILNRAKHRGKALPPRLKNALETQAGMVSNENTMSTDSASNVPIAFEPGAMSRLGGHVWEDKTGTLLADMGDNQMSVCTQSTVYGISSYNSNSMKSDNPHSGIYETDIARTIDTNGSNPACNQGGNVVVEDSVYCIQGNAIDRSDKSGCNGKGWTEDVCYTLTAADRPAVVYSIDQGGGKSSVNIAENISPTLTTTHGGSPVVCYGVQENQRSECRLSKELSPTLQTNGGKHGQGNPVVLIEEPRTSDKYVAAFAYQIGGKMPHLPYNEDLSPTLTKNQKMAVLIENHPNDSRVTISEDNICQTLTSRMGTGGGNVPLVMETEAKCYSQSGFADYKEDDCGTLRASGEVLEDHSETLIVDKGNIESDDIYALTTGYFQSVNKNIAHTLLAHEGDRPQVIFKDIKDVKSDSVVAMTTGSFQGISENTANTLMAGEYKHQQIVFKPHSIVRRLTPLECERLQGFPDNWTESESDAARYKAMGNSVALPCVNYVINGIVDALSE